jgi:hypothetical protein
MNFRGQILKLGHDLFLSSAFDPKRTFRAYYRRSIDLAKSHNAVAANNKTKLALTYCLNLWIARASQWIVDTTTAAKLSVVYE